MIRTVTVYTGRSPYSLAAQEHAIEAARLFGARLKVVAIWGADGDKATAESGVPVPELMTQERGEIAARAAQAGVKVAEGLRGDGITRGLLEEARETDLLVLGMPTEADKQTDDVAAGLIRRELPVLRKAECAILAVDQPPRPVRKIMAQYSEGPAAKTMLRLAATWAEKLDAALTVLTVQNDVARATELAAAAEEYLKGFNLSSVETHPEKGPTDSKIPILAAADALGPDMIAMGEEGHSFLERFLGMNVAERTALATPIPLLICRC